MSEDPDRRKFLKVTTCAIGGGVGLLATVPVARMFAHPLGEQTVTTPSAPIDVGPASRYLVGDAPRKVDVIAPVIQDGWAAARDVVLGAAWIRRTGEQPDQLDARSAICPHLGCAVGYDAAAKNYLCPCHDSRFAISGDKLTGPSERGLDPLPLTIVGGRVRLTWVRYRIGSANRERA
jgi:Rieske Fe-S protein